MTPPLLPRSTYAAHAVRARLLRRVSGSTSLNRTMRKAVRTLAEANIPSLVVGGYAVQENGYARFTSDVDLVVPDIAAARLALCANGFRENPGSTMTVTDRATRVEVDLLPAGGAVGPGPLKLPIPTHLSTEPTIADLRTLIEIKLSSYLGSPGARLKDLADVVELVKSNRTPRDLALNSAVTSQYLESWDRLHADEQRRSE